MKICQSCTAAFDGGAWICPACGFTPLTRDGYSVLAPEAEDGRGFPKDEFARLAALEEGSFWFLSRGKLISWAVRRYFPRARTFLEVGCGTGFVLAHLARSVPGLRLSGGDLHGAGLAFAAGRVPSAFLGTMDVERLPFDGEFDLVGAFDVLEHVPDDLAALDRMNRALVPGGGLVLTVPQHPFLWSRADDHACHLRRYRRVDLGRSLDRCGFTAVRMTSFVHYLFPLMILVRMMKRSGPGVGDISGEHRSGRAANALLEGVMSLERVCIRMGADLPFGGSLLAVAVKR